MRGLSFPAVRSESHTRDNSVSAIREQAPWESMSFRITATEETRRVYPARAFWLGADIVEEPARLKSSTAQPFSGSRKGSFRTIHTRRVTLAIIVTFKKSRLTSSATRWDWT